ncbi:MAG TPA: type IV pilin N-terminal domain-containing protein [Methanoregula sp.]|nr:type IV pilin N-terminal domain-containing protein [Methanoregula sp.]
MRNTAKRIGNDRAVSPVVGVMLMLVVVIIIAAVVSGFAGGLMGTSGKAPQATIQATYSQSAGMLTMFHAGGDELSTQNVFLVVRGIDSENGGYSGTMSRNVVNRSLICNTAGTCWAAPTGYVTLAVWRPGETMVCNDTADFKVTYSTGNQLNPYPLPGDVGKSFALEIDTTDGKVISKTTVKIGP